MYLYQFHYTYLEFLDYTCYMEIHMELGDYTYYTYWLVYRCLKREGSVLSRSELDPFLYIRYHTVGIQIGLAPVAYTEQI